MYIIKNIFAVLGALTLSVGILFTLEVIMIGSALSLGDKGASIIGVIMFGIILLLTVYSYFEKKQLNESLFYWTLNLILFFGGTLGVVFNLSVFFEI